MQLAASLNPNLEGNQSGPEGLVLAIHVSEKKKKKFSSSVKFKDRVDKILLALQMIKGCL